MKDKIVTYIDSTLEDYESNPNWGNSENFIDIITTQDTRGCEAIEAHYDNNGISLTPIVEGEVWEYEYEGEKRRVCFIGVAIWNLL